MSNNLSCLERATFITAESKSLNSCKYIDMSVFEYLQACELHNLQIGKGIAKAIMSSNSKSYFCRNLCDISIFENPLTHYAQNARLSLYFAIALESVHNSNDLYVIEFFLGSNNRKEACNDSAQNLLIKTMENELKSYKVALGGQLIGKELLVELGKPNAVQYESSEYAKEIKHQHSEELNMFMLMERYWESYSESNFQTYLQTADLCFLRPSKKDECGWVFGSQSREELFDINSNSSLVPDPIKNKIKLFMNEIASKFLPGFHWLVQFWAPKMGQGRCYLATLDQPYALSRLQKGLAFFRKQCMKHHYFMDDGAKEEELGPPGRVFRNGHPEMTPDLRLYSIREFSLKNHAVQCRLQGYYALPVFDIDQYKCVGVLELLEFGGCVSDEDIVEALEAADLSSTIFGFERCFEASHVPSNIARLRDLALMEVKEALELIGDIPQLYKAEVRVPYDNSNLSCMQLVLSTECEVEYMDMYHIHVQTGKGIVGMALASEDKSCFCRNSCDFTITEQPRAHHEQQERLDVCFAICLQSSHTGNLLYVLEFFLNQGPATYEYLLSFLKFLLPIMKQELTSFKLASGKQLGDQLVVEVIEFSEENKLTFSELDQTEIFPIRFKIVQYGQKEHHHGNDQQVQYVSDSIDSIRSSAAKNPKKEHAAKKTEEGKGKTSLHLNLVDLEPHFGRRLDDVAEELGVGRSTIKRVLRKNNITRWPNNKKYKKNPPLFMKESASSEIARDFQQNMHPSGSGNVPLLQNMPQTNTESTQHLIVGVEAKEVIIKVKYENDTIRFLLNLSSGIEKLVEEVARRLNLKKGSFKLKYVDEDNDEILIGCDDDLKLCPKSLNAAGKTFIQLFV